VPQVIRLDVVPRRWREVVRMDYRGAAANVTPNASTDCRAWWPRRRCARPCFCPARPVWQELRASQW